jgi:hypothetical protein
MAFRDTANTRQFLGNAILWASNWNQENVGELRIGVSGVGGLTEELNRLGILARELSGDNWAGARRNRSPRMEYRRPQLSSAIWRIGVRSDVKSC